jgi:hypothetical protein
VQSGHHRYDQARFALHPPLLLKGELRLLPDEAESVIPAVLPGSCLDWRWNGFWLGL